MFTNWLTGTTGTSTAASASVGPATARNSNTNGNRDSSSSSSSGHHSIRHGNLPLEPSGAPPPPPPTIMSSPPDVILEVGPAPGGVRFVAHSLVLGMHSGYLRSAIRLDETLMSGGGGSVAGVGHPPSAADIVLYLGNVTAEQFAPLLTYMYTGYLDLNMENIFGVLLATHVLHMPRALEICRSFLARAQTEGYFTNSLPGVATPSATVTAINSSSNNNNNNNMNNNINNNNQSSSSTTAKIIRPIPSKATLPNLGFLPAAVGGVPVTHPTLPLALPASSNPYKCLQQQMYAASHLMAERQNVEHHRPRLESIDRDSERSHEIDVDCHSSTRQDDDGNGGDDVDDDDERIVDDDEDEEVFIDTNSEPEEPEVIDGRGGNRAAAVNRMRTMVEAVKTAPPGGQERPVTGAILRNSKPPEKKGKSQQKSQRPAANGKTASRRDKRKQQQQQQPQTRPQLAATSTASTASGLQVAKAPIPASQLDADEGSKVIIDVASCDGPVRFRRILNTAYGHKPDAFAVMPERTQQSLSLSFHQQMAKTISQQRQLQQAEESENSESSGGGGGGGACSGGVGGERTASGKHSKAASNEIYVCVYCKHTFKSQYCYQKHAKRHLNPMSLGCAGTDLSEKVAATEINGGRIGEGGTAAATAAAYQRAAQQHTLPLPIVTSQKNANELLRREVRPLDMNVQYYPCKTCGSKFPSYYFVHKHRKMCHADEEAADNERNARTNGQTGGSASGGGAELPTDGNGSGNSAGGNEDSRDKKRLL